jgi:hypothetical protein
MTRALAILGLVSIGACSAGPDAPIGDIVGTWGGVDAGLIATDSTVHVHIGCTKGDVAGIIHADTGGHFDVPGLYNVNAYPVDLGILHPARFTGQISGRTMVLTVTLTDTTRTLGPVTLTYGTTPQMAACPICREPAHAAARAHLKSMFE